MYNIIIVFTVVPSGFVINELNYYNVMNVVVVHDTCKALLAFAECVAVSDNHSNAMSVGKNQYNNSPSVSNILKQGIKETKHFLKSKEGGMQDLLFDPFSNPLRIYETKCE